MAQELLEAKGDTKELGLHWTEQFLSRYPSLKSKFVRGLDKT
jgi:DDE superfamily endonuclease